MNAPPERLLWAAVLLRAWQDAAGIYLNSAKSNAMLEQYEARIWIERAGKDFGMVCCLAGRDPEYTRSAMLRRAPVIGDGISVRRGMV